MYSEFVSPWLGFKGPCNQMAGDIERYGTNREVAIGLSPVESEQLKKYLYSQTVFPVGYSTRVRRDSSNFQLVLDHSTRITQTIPDKVYAILDETLSQGRNRDSKVLQWVNLIYLVAGGKKQ